MEVSRSFLPENNFLQNIRNLCSKKNIILIFDECTSGLEKHLVVYIRNIILNQIFVLLEKQWVTGMLLQLLLVKRISCKLLKILL